VGYQVSDFGCRESSIKRIIGHSEKLN